MFGINAAAFLQQLHFLLSSAKEDGKLYNYVDGQWWVYYSYPNWTKKLPWLKPKTVQRIANDLVKRGVIHTRVNPHKTWDRSLWYRLDYDAFHAQLEADDASEQSDQMPSGHFDQMDADNVSRSNGTESPDVNITISNDLTTEKIVANATDVSSPLPKPGSYQALTGKSDAECEAERLIEAEKQRALDEWRMNMHNHVAQLETDIKHYLPDMGGSLATKYARVFYGIYKGGKGKRKSADDNAYLEQTALLRGAPVTPNEFTAWADEYCKARGIKPADPTMVKSIEKIVSSILARRERLATGTPASNDSNFGAANWQNDFWDTFDGKVGA
jgi:uncharacterized protein YdaT